MKKAELRVCFYNVLCIIFQKLLFLHALLVVFKMSSGNTCRTTINTTEFERQLHHLHYLPNDVHFLNHSRPNNVDDSRCNSVPNISPVFLNERSVCPWDMVEDINENRYPQVLNFAKCRCSKCLSQFGNFECRPVSYRIPVFEKRCIGNKLEYIKTYTDVPVGCTCSRPRVVTVTKRVINLFRRRLKLRRSKHLIYHGMKI